MASDRPELRLVSPAVVTWESCSGLVRHLRGRDLTAEEPEGLRRQWGGAGARGGGR
jgi:hypothetical protein